MQNSFKKKGKLFLIPVGLGSADSSYVIPGANSKIVQNLDEFIVENIRSARRFLRSIGYTKDFKDVIFHVIDKHAEESDFPSYVKNTETGRDIGLLSEAGNPCIADPGNKIVAIAHQKNITVTPLVGPSSILLALIASGFNGQSFTFHGYLPLERKKRIQKIKELEKAIRSNRQTQIFMETPYRNQALLQDIITTCNPSSLLCIASNITLENEYIKTMSIAGWNKQTPDLHKQPSVFLLYQEND